MQDQRSPEEHRGSVGDLGLCQTARSMVQSHMILRETSSQLEDSVVRKGEFEAAHPEVTMEFDQATGLHVARFPGPDGPQELKRCWLGKLLNDLECLLAAE
jgi:hypothetical protein